MADQSTNGRDRLDRATSASICRAIGEKLLGATLAEASDVPPRFQSLLAAMQEQERRQDAETETPGSPTAAG